MLNMSPAGFVPCGSLVNLNLPGGSRKTKKDFYPSLEWVSDNIQKRNIKLQKLKILDLSSTSVQSILHLDTLGFGGFC